ncbi:CfrBI family restriction endonuclease [Campylobacter lari]|uniref:CfrBI family restriction endonuclease n=1 Tax=Campylobacter lari TaxID=201 RepID=UPI0012D18ACC|nr:CfrBI family restriction endonuclease [Campylobacter lari]EAI7252339.1 CfrBI family restriction endonuclease [Campylobacter lari]EAJ1270108.1 CfrBI family restriction endonuclease [Campylobacter lari]EAL0060447.1 CfrBI family restriction endonuclease [Campylobacter lari]ECL4969401.1 CfrBI family restriction endonuclease [Campylobacter lari]EHL5011080.1 CfrBI family restriction endonuclease [Campylobacter lari]
MRFDKIVIDNTIDKLLQGKDYREEVVNAINLEFLDFALDFFRKILDAKMNDTALNLTWYKKHFINNESIKPDEAAIFAGMNKKTISNIYGSATKEIVLNVANTNIDYLEALLNSLDESEDNIGICLKISYKNIAVELNLNESLLVINALATKKIALRGGAWSSIGKRVEKPLMLALCRECGVEKEFINSEVFKKNGELDFDREVDFKLYNTNKSREYRIEVKLMGRGNPESADAVIARDTDIFVADTLSLQNKNQLKSLGIKFLELKNNQNCIKDFKEILLQLNIPFKE